MTLPALIDRLAQRDAHHEEHGLHHEIYLSDPRKCALEKPETAIRHPIKPI